MKTTISLITLFSISFFCACTSEVDCTDPRLEPTFVGYTMTELDTLIYTKFKAGSNFTVPLDTFLVDKSRAHYTVKHDTINIFETVVESRILPGSDWQIFVPAANRTVLIADIASSHEKGKVSHGIFSMDHFGPPCMNTIYSAKLDSQNLTFTKNDSLRYFLYIPR